MWEGGSHIERYSGINLCQNSWIAPYNFEGFMPNFGDLLVKSGAWETAQKVYALARLSKSAA